ncbi:PilN domain-containing protein [bacterium]|nr:PilN domain-containing protein [bacterium]
MIKINLLPKELRKKKKVPFFDKYFMYVFFGLLIGLGLLWFETKQQQTEIGALETEIARVQADIQRYSKQVKMVEEAQALRDKIKTRIAAIKMLDIQRPLWVKIFENFSELIPEFLWINEFSEVEKIITVKGTSYNLNGVANFIVGLIQSDYTDDIKLNFIREANSTQEGVNQYNFELSGKLVFTSAEKYSGEFIAADTTEQEEAPTITPKVAPLGRKALGVEKDITLDAVKKIQPKGPPR